MTRRLTTKIAVLLAVALALPAAAQVKDWRKIKYPTLPELRIEKPTIFMLDNGMKVFLMEDRELPLISAFARVRTGANWEPADKTGLAGIFGQALREGGTRTMTGDEIDEYLAQRAASVETSVGQDTGFASASSLVEHFDDTLAVLADVLRRPVFDEDKVGLAKKQTSSVIARRNDDISGITGREFSRLIYGPDSPLGRLTEYATVSAVERADLVAWHEKYFHPNNIMLGVVGDFDTEQMKRKIRATFGDWERGPQLKLADVAYNKRVKPGVYFIEKSDVTQAYVRLGHLGMKTSTDPDYYAAQVMNEVLGGSFASRLFSQVRSKKGLAYSVFGGIGSSMAHQGIFQVGLSTKSGTMGEAVAALKQEVRGIIDNPPSAEELERAKESILNSFVFRFDNKGQILGQLMSYDYHGLPLDFLDTYRERIDAVTAEDVARVAKRYVHPDELAVLVVGKSEEFDVPVSTLGEVTPIDISIPPPPDTTPEIARTPESLEAGKQLFSKMVSLISNGAAEAIRAVRSSSSLALSMNGQTMNAGQEWSFELPDKLRRTLTLPVGQQTLVVNGTEGYMAMGSDKQPLPASLIEEVHRDLIRDLLYLAIHHQDPDLETVAAGQDEVDGRSCRMLAVSFHGVDSRMCIDAEGHVLSQSYQGKHPLQQTPGRLEVRYSDYGDFDGRRLPARRVVTFEGEKVLTVDVNSLDINPELDPDQFVVN